VIAYHVTNSRHRASIAREGIRLSDIDGKHIWLFTDREIALAASEGSWGGLTPAEVWEVDITGYETAPDPHPGWGNRRPGWDDAAIVIFEAVPPERVRLLTLSKVP
jgi:hypothetical protein